MFRAPLRTKGEIVGDRQSGAICFPNKVLHGISVDVSNTVTLSIGKHYKSYWTKELRIQFLTSPGTSKYTQS